MKKNTFYFILFLLQNVMCFGSDMIDTVKYRYAITYQPIHLFDIDDDEISIPLAFNFEKYRLSKNSSYDFYAGIGWSKEYFTTVNRDSRKSISLESGQRFYLSKVKKKQKIGFAREEKVTFSGQPKGYFIRPALGLNLQYSSNDQLGDVYVVTSAGLYVGYKTIFKHDWTMNIYGGLVMNYDFGDFDYITFLPKISAGFGLQN